MLRAFIARMNGVEPWAEWRADQGELVGLDAVDDAVADFPLHLAVAEVAPPDQDVGLRERLLGEVRVVLVGLILGRHRDGANGQRRVLLQMVGDRVAEEVVAVRLLLRGLLLVPDQHADGRLVGGTPRSRQKAQRERRRGCGDDGTAGGGVGHGRAG